MRATTASAFRHSAAALLLSLIAGCASTSGSNDSAGALGNDSPESEAKTDNGATAGAVYDPIEGLNRRVFKFNEALDGVLLKPAAAAWTFVTPPQARRSVGNFFDNLAAPGQVLNNALQGKGGAAATDVGRFVVNSTVGIVGLFDVASRMGLETRPEDFGQTLGVWGGDSGAYLMLPLLGPSSTRDVTQYPVAWYTDILTHVSLDTAARGSLLALEVVNTRARLGRALSVRDEAALDPYAFTRSSYQQQRRNRIHDGSPPTGDDDPYGDFFNEGPGAPEGDAEGSPATTGD